MAVIQNRYIYFNTKSEFLSHYTETTDGGVTYGDISKDSIVYIRDTREIWTHGTFYKCSGRIYTLAALDTTAKVLEFRNNVAIGDVIRWDSADDMLVTTIDRTSTANQFVYGIRDNILWRIATTASGTLTNGQYTFNLYSLPVVNIARGGTGATSATSAASNLQVLSFNNPAGISTDVTALSSLTKGSYYAAATRTFTDSPVTGVAIRVNVFEVGPTSAGVLLQQLWCTSGLYYRVLPDVEWTKIYTAEAGSATPLANGTATCGTSLKYSREDHIHPLQSSVAQLTTARTIALSGAVAGSNTFNGTSNMTITTTLANLPSSKVTALTGYLKPANTSSIEVTDTLNVALGKLECKIDILRTTIATETTPGLVKPVKVNPNNPSINSITTTSNRYYSVEMNSTGNMFVNVPWTAWVPTSAGIISALGYTPADADTIPSALRNPYALNLNDTLYTGEQTVTLRTLVPLTTYTLTSTTIAAGRKYVNTGITEIRSTLGFSVNNPSCIIYSTTKLTFTASTLIVAAGIEDIFGDYYIYCFEYIPTSSTASKIAVNGAAYSTP